jgi:hypothetical protein
MKEKLLSFVFINFSASGLFNGLRPIQIKSSSSRLKAALVVQWGTPVPQYRQGLQGGHVSHHEILIRLSVLGKKISTGLRNSLASPAKRWRG